jgi:hypothetical protein
MCLWKCSTAAGALSILEKYLANKIIVWFVKRIIINLNIRCRDHIWERLEPKVSGAAVSSPLSVHIKHCLKPAVGNVRKISENIHEKNLVLFPFSVANKSSNFPRDASNLLSCGRKRNSSTTYLVMNVLFVVKYVIKKISEALLYKSHVWTTY